MKSACSEGASVSKGKKSLQKIKLQKASVKRNAIIQKIIQNENRLDDFFNLQLALSGLSDFDGLIACGKSQC